MTEQTAVLDQLIQDIEEALRAVEGLEFTAGEATPPRKATLRITGEVFSSMKNREASVAEVFAIRKTQMVLRIAENLPRGALTEVSILSSKTAEGERIHVLEAEVQNAKRCVGGYQMTLRIVNLSRMDVPIEERFREFVVGVDPAGWNRWSADLTEGPILREIDLRDALLSYFDLTCADLRGSNLAAANLSHAQLGGADLSNCNLDGVQIAGADLFGATLPARYQRLVAASGMVEAESVRLVEDACAVGE